MTSNCHRLLLFVAIIGAMAIPFNVVGQKNAKELDSLQSVVTKRFIPSIATGLKVEEIPTYKDTTPLLSPKNISIKPKPIETSFELAPIKPASMLGEPLSKLYNSLVKLQLSLPYNIIDGEAFYNSLRSKDLIYGVDIKSLTSEWTLPHVGNSGYSDNTLSLYAKKFLSKSTLSFNFDYSRDAVHYYGYNPGIEPIPSKDSILQRFSYISPSIRLQSHLKDTTKLNYDMRVKYYNLSDLFQTSENNVNADITLKKYYQGYNIAVASDFDYLNTRQVHDTNNDLTIRLAPGFNFTRNKLTAIIGSPFAFDINSKTNVYWYPTAEFNYTLVDYIFIGYGGIEGALDRNSFKTFTDLNPFTSSFVNLTNSNRHDIYLGGRGSIDRQTTFNVQATYAEIQNMPLFISQSLAGITNKFNVIYDNAEHFNMHGEITYRKSSKWLFVFSGDYNYYKMATQQHAWYTPQIQLNASMIYNLKDKISLKSDVYYIGKQLARIDENSLPAVVKSLNGLIDVNLSIEYKYTRLLSFFVSGDNLAGIRYQRWYNYPSQSAYGMLGVLLKF